MGSPEQLHGGVENSLEGVGEAAERRSKETLKLLESSTEHDKDERNIGAERKGIERIFSKEKSAGEHKKAHIDAPAEAPRLLTKKDRDQSYRLTMERVQSELSGPEKTFSKIIHNEAVEKTSDALGRTVARPNAILAGSITAFVLVAAVYTVARAMGYRLSGFETIGAFILGWGLGFLYDYARILYKGHS